MTSRQTWTTEEDDKCREALLNYLREENLLVQFYRTQQLPKGIPWTLVSKAIETRDGKQCRERFINQLSPFIKKSDWTLEEDFLLQKLVLEHETRWKKISMIMKGRTPNQVKMRWKRLKNGGIVEQNLSSLRKNNFFERKPKPELARVESIDSGREYIPCYASLDKSLSMDIDTEDELQHSLMCLVDEEIVSEVEEEKLCGYRSQVGRIRRRELYSPDNQQYRSVRRKDKNRGYSETTAMGDYEQLVRDAELDGRDIPLVQNSLFSHQGYRLF